MHAIGDVMTFAAFLGPCPVCHRDNDLLFTHDHVIDNKVKLLELLCMMLKTAVESGDAQQQTIALEKFHLYETKYGWLVDKD